MTKYKVTIIRRLYSEPILIKAESVQAAIEHARSLEVIGVLPANRSIAGLTFEVEAAP